MAFQKSTTIKGFTYPEAYWRIGRMQADKIYGQFTFSIQCYPNADSRLENVNNFIDERVYYTPFSMTDAECYTYLLTLKDAEDDSGEAFFLEAEVV